MHSSSFDTEILNGKDGGEVLVAIAALITEGRIPGAGGGKSKTKIGFYEGPHCIQNKNRNNSATTTEVNHQCDLNDVLCSKYESVRVHVLNLWRKNIPVCVEVLLICSCKQEHLQQPEDEEEDENGQDQKREEFQRNSAANINNLTTASSTPSTSFESNTEDEEDGDFLLEKWYFSINHRRSAEPLPFNFVQLISAIRSQLYFSQLTAWLSVQDHDDANEPDNDDDNNMKKITSSNLKYRLTIPGETFESTEFSTSAIKHDFPIADIGNGYTVTVSFQSLPRMSSMPNILCQKCTQKFETNSSKKSSNKKSAGGGKIIKSPTKNNFEKQPTSNKMDEDRRLVDDRTLYNFCHLTGKHRCEDSAFEDKTESGHLQNGGLTAVNKVQSQGKRHCYSHTKSKKMQENCRTCQNNYFEPSTSSTMGNPKLTAADLTYTSPAQKNNFKLTAADLKNPKPSVQNNFHFLTTRLTAADSDLSPNKNDRFKLTGDLNLTPSMQNNSSFLTTKLTAVDCDSSPIKNDCFKLTGDLNSKPATLNSCLTGGKPKLTVDINKANGFLASRGGFCQQLQQEPGTNLPQTSEFLNGVNNPSLVDGDPNTQKNGSVNSPQINFCHNLAKNPVSNFCNKCNKNDLTSKMKSKRIDGNADKGKLLLDAIERSGQKSSQKSTKKSPSEKIRNIFGPDDDHSGNTCISMDACDEPEDDEEHESGCDSKSCDSLNYIYNRNCVQERNVDIAKVGGSQQKLWSDSYYCSSSSDGICDNFKQTSERSDIPIITNNNNNKDDSFNSHNSIRKNAGKSKYFDSNNIGGGSSSTTTTQQKINGSSDSNSTTKIIDSQSSSVDDSNLLRSNFQCDSPVSFTKRLHETLLSQSSASNSKKCKNIDVPMATTLVEVAQSQSQHQKKKKGPIRKRLTFDSDEEDDIDLGARRVNERLSIATTAPSLTADNFRSPTKDHHHHHNGSNVATVDIPSASEQAKFRKELDNAASMVFHARTGLPLTSSPAPVRRGKTCFDFDSSINSVSAIKSALFPTNFTTDDESESDGSIVSPCSPETGGCALPKNELQSPAKRHRKGHAANLLGSFEESVLNGRLEPVSTVHGFTAELGASGSFVPKHLLCPVTVFFYTLGDNDKVSSPYLGHINLGKKGYSVPKSGTVQVTLFNPLGTVVKMFVIMYDLRDMPPNSQTFIRQRTLYMPTNCATEEDGEWGPKWLRFLIHLRFISSKSGKIYLHSDIRMIIFRKSDMDTATAHGIVADNNNTTNTTASYELRSFTHMPSNPRFSPRK